MTSTPPPPTAFVYDRHVTEIETELDRRLKTCAAYIRDRGWGFGGWWTDRGDHALSEHRPAFEELLDAMRTAAPGPRVCLIYDWGRLSHEMGTRGLMTRRILLTGADCWVETCDGETRTADGRYRQVGRLTAGPVTA